MRREEGFTLIEMMVALAILTLAGLAVLNMMQASTRNAAAVEARSLAMLAAENVLSIELVADASPESRDGSYELAGVEYDWDLSVEATTDRDLLRIVLTIHEAGEDRVLARVETYRRRRA